MPTIVAHIIPEFIVRASYYIHVVLIVIEINVAGKFAAKLKVTNTNSIKENLKYNMTCLAVVNCRPLYYVSSKIVGRLVFFLRLKTNQKCCSNIGKGNCGCVKKNCRYAQVLFVFLLISHVLTR